MIGLAEWIMVADDNQSVLKNAGQILNKNQMRVTGFQSGEALPQAAVRSWIEKGSGTQFDPVFAIIMPGIMDEDPDFTFRE